MIREIYLDFDGVIMDTMSLKLDSYCYALEGLGLEKDAVRRIQLRDAGLSRHATLRHMYEELLMRPMAEDVFSCVLARFTEHDEASRDRMRPMPGAIEFLREAHGKWLLSVITGTPQDVIERTMSQYDLGHWFAEVRGAPPGKVAHLGELLAKHGVRPNEALFVGDSPRDEEAAVEVSIPFVYLDAGAWEYRATHAVHAVSRLDALLPWLESRDRA